MNRTQLPINEIIVQDRQRDCKPEAVESLAVSMSALGLIQPVVVNQEKRLIAGGHRIAAAVKLGWTVIDVVYKETLSEAELQELELTENIKRSDLTWQERVLAVAKIHALKKRTAALASSNWGQKETGDLLNISQGYVSYAIAVAKALQAFGKETEIWQCDNVTDAYTLIMRWQQEVAEEDLAKRHVASKPVPVVAPISIEAASTFDLSAFDVDDSPPAEGKIIGYTPQIPPEDVRIACPVCNGINSKGCQHCMDTGFAWDTTKVQRGAQITVSAVYEEYHEVVVDVSSHYFKVDSIEYMLTNPNRFDHIITDIPYGIDIDMIDQSNSIADIDTIKAEHTVEGNEALFAQFFPAAFTTLKDNAFLITWCDQMQWQLMYNLATAAGFKVQRWPIIWSKSYPCLNQMAQYNFTKSTEIAMVMHKGVITLAEKQPTNVISCGRDDLQELINHPFAKPFTLWERLIKAVSIENQAILDPFCGRGSSFLSGLQLGRNMYGCEINDAHYNAGLENIKTFYRRLNPKTLFK